MAADGRTVAVRPGRTPAGEPMRVEVRKKGGGGQGQARDQIGHWVAPPGMRAHPCPHRCCQGRQVHPDALPVKLDRKYLRSLDQEELDRELSAYQRYSDERTGAYIQVIAEMQRREDAPAVAEAGRAKARETRTRSESEYRDEVYRQWLAAENYTNGYMLNKAGKRAGIDERTLFTTSSQARVDRYASDELQEYFRMHPRPSRKSWQRSRRAMREPPR